MFAWVPRFEFGIGTELVVQSEQMTKWFIMAQFEFIAQLVRL